MFSVTFFESTPPEQASVYDLLRNAIGKQDRSKSNRLLVGLSNTGQRLKLISKHPAISVTTLDVLLTTVTLLVWTFLRDIDVESILENSVLSFLTPRKVEKHVAFEGKTKKEVEDAAEPESSLSAVTPKRRGRPRKGTLTNGTSSSTSASASSTGTLRRSTRKKTRSDYESDAEESYEPSVTAEKEVTQTEADGATTAEDIVRGGEATALALCLAFVGGLGQLASGVLGAELTGIGE